MKFVALISGGKDSILSAVMGVKDGNELVAFANLYPIGKEDADSYMYQTVGHSAVPLIAEAAEIPIFRRAISGVSLCKSKTYEKIKNDEVEDLYELLLSVKDKIPGIGAVSTGAVYSDYQRNRVENICNRLELIHFANLWHKPPLKLLKLLHQYKIKAILIKTACYGLSPDKFLGQNVLEMEPELRRISETTGEMTLIGEGGEYETFTLDCPLFKRPLILTEWDIKGKTDDPICPTGYLQMRKIEFGKFK